MKGKMPLAVILTLAVLLSASIGIVLAAPKNMDEGDPWTWSRGNARFTELQNKELPDWAPITGDGRWGWIVHGYKMTEGNFDGELEVKGLEPNSWFLVTLYSDDPLTAYFLGQVGYYGYVPKPNWADIALFRTDPEGNAEIELPYTSPATDPVFGTLTAPTLPTGEYKDVLVNVKYVGTGGTPDWGLVMSGGYVVGGTPDALDYNIYEMVPLEFTIWDKLLLVKKDPEWEVISENGELTYRSGPEFYYKFEGWDLKPNTAYSLIYYADPWPGNHPGALIASGTTDENGKIKLEGSIELNMDLPDPNDANHPTGAKIWLVLSSDYNAATNSMVVWRSAEYLFESKLITYDDTDV